MSLPMSTIISGGLCLSGDGNIKPVTIVDCAGVVGTVGQVLSSTGTALEWITPASGGSAATPLALGTVFGCTDSATFNTALGCCVLGALTGGGEYNVALGFAAGNGISTGSCNIAIGPSVTVADGTQSCQLAIGFSGSDNWLTGDCTKAIKPGAGVIDCAASCGTAGQVLQSTGSNSIVWATPASGYSGYRGYKTAVTNGTKFNVTGWPREVGRFWMGQLNIFTSYGTDPTYTSGSNVLIMINGYNGLGTSTIQSFSTASGTFGLEANSYPAYTDTTVVFTPSLNANRMNFYIRYLDASGEGGPGNSDGNPFASYLTIF